MNIYVDIDETICYYEGEREYQYAIDIPQNIDKINKLYDEGNTITYWTARGNMSGIDHTELTKKQLSAWGCKFHKLITGSKPSFDLLIDDKWAPVSTAPLGLSIKQPMYFLACRYRQPITIV
jgi:hypothetical protein